MKNPLKSTRGEGYIDAVITTLCSIMLIVLAINTFSFLTLKQDMDYFAKELLATATTDGRISSNVSDRYTELAEEIGISPDVSWETTYFNETQQTVQLGEVVKIELTYHTTFEGLGTLLQIPMTVTVSHSGLSQRYWK